MTKGTTTIGKYLVHRLEQAGLKHVFGIPGDYVLRFYDLLTSSRMDVIGTTTEAAAGFAADAYARVNGLGAVCVTYCVGGLNALNAIAGAYAEKSPVILISGAPGLSERERSPLLHHKVRDFDTQRRIFESVTVATAALENPDTAAQEIDDTIEACIRHKRPVYIEIPRDMVDQPCRVPLRRRSAAESSDPDVLAEAMAEASAMLRKAKRPVILAGVEIHRFGLQGELLKFVERSGYPVASTLLGKSVISEVHPQYLGVYEGAVGQEHVRKRVEAADVLLILGAFLTDIDLGLFTARLDPSRCINAGDERISISHHHFDHVTMPDFITALSRAPIGPRRRGVRTKRPVVRPYVAKVKQPMTVARFFERMNGFLDDSTIVICDIGDSLFGAADLTIHRRTEFVSPAYYTSMGFAVPACIGAQVNNRRLRPIVFVGDGAFQMTGQELSTAVRHGLNPIVFVLNNKGYTTERFIREGPYNDIHDWAYHLVPQIYRDGWGCEVRTEEELEHALARAAANTRSFSLVNVHLDKYDRSDALERLATRLGTRVQRSRRGKR